MGTSELARETRAHPMLLLARKVVLFQHCAGIATEGERGREREGQGGDEQGRKTSKVKVVERCAKDTLSADLYCVCVRLLVCTRCPFNALSPVRGKGFVACR